MNELILSFLDHPSFLVQDFLIDNFLGIDKVDLIYHDAQTGELSFRRARKKGEHIEYDDSMRTPQFDDQLLLQNEKRSPRWLKEEDLPYSLKANAISEPTIDDEFDVKILFCTLHNFDARKIDYCYVFLKNRANSFGIKKENKNITVSDLEVFSFALEHFFSEILKKTSNDRQIYNSIMQANDVKRLKIEELQEQTHLNKQRIQHLYREYIEDQMEEIQMRSGKLIMIPESVYELFEKNAISLSQAKTIITEAAIRAINLSFDQEVQIDESDIIIPKPVDENNYRPPLKISVPMNLPRENKVRNFLTELERVVTNQLKMKSSITSAVVGTLTNPTLTAPAIRDKLLKNKILVQRILKTESETFKNIISYFKPVIRILEEEKKTA